MLASLKTTDVRSRVEPEIKEHATQVLAQCGLTLSDGIRLFLRQVIAERGLPFDVKVPNAETQAAMAEARAQNALSEVQEFTSFLRVLGSYPMDMTSWSPSPPSSSSSTLSL